MPARRSRDSSRLSERTPYKDYLYTNVVPSEDECRRIHDFVGVLEQEADEATDVISRMQAALDHMQVSLDQMVSKRDQLEESIDSHLALVSGARRLPHDILGEIFMACLPQGQYPSLKRTESPWLISHICGQWRSQVLSMPRLWASLHIPRYTPFCRPYHRPPPAEAVMSWLGRSGNLPLSISCSIYDLDWLRQFAPRWEHVRIVDLPDGSVEPKSLARLSQAGFPSLKTLVIHCENMEEEDPDALSFFCALTVRALSIRGYNSAGVRDLVLSGGLVHLSLHRVLQPHALTALGQCPNLETFTLLDEAYEYTRPTTPVPTSPIHLGHLQRLSVIRSGIDLAYYLVLPNLQSFEYTHTGDLTWTLDACIEALDKCGAAALKELSISIEQGSTATLPAVLRRFAMLENLLLHIPQQALTAPDATASDTEPSLLALLTPLPDSSEVLCPHLQKISFLGLDVGSDEELLTMINARRVHALSDVHIAFTRPLDVDIAPELPADGLALNLCYATTDNLKLIKANDERRVFLRGNSYRERERPLPPPPAQVQSWRRGADVDWAPASEEWRAEYDGWGVEEETDEAEAEHKSGQESSEEDD
ncbi:hypothetical protein DFH06DRAFT_758118 [Mycena polygramma]|nr:hypothetical protein DFH06DRAFT_758118 [Mycena polygramma]